MNDYYFDALCQLLQLMNDYSLVDHDEIACVIRRHGVAMCDELAQHCDAAQRDRLAQCRVMLTVE